MGTTGGVAAAVRLLEAGVAALSDVDIEALSDGQQLALVRVVHPLVCRMEAQRSRVIGSVHRRGAVFADGAVSTGAWLRSRLRMSDGQARVRAAAAARQVSELETIYAAGEGSYAQVSVVASVVPDSDPEVLAAGAGRLLAEQAQPARPGAAAARRHPHQGSFRPRRRAAAGPTTAGGTLAERGPHLRRRRGGAGRAGPRRRRATPHHADRADATAGAARPAHPGAPARGCVAGPVPAGRQPHPDRGWGETPRHR